MNSSHNQEGRILLGLGPTSDGDRSIVTAITLAKAIHREIIGLFVIEDEMIEIAALPFTNTLEIHTAQRVELTPAIMIKALDRSAAHCRQSLSVHAQKAHVSWSFSIKSGELPECLSAAVLAGDFLIVSGDPYGFGNPQYLLDQLHFVPADAAAIVIASTHAPRKRNGPIIALDDGDEAGERTIVLASRIAGNTGRELIVLALATNEEQARKITQRARELLPARQKLTVHRLVPEAVIELKATLAHLSPSFIIADMQGQPFANNEAARTLLRSTRAPIILLQA